MQSTRVLLIEPDALLAKTYAQAFGLAGCVAHVAPTAQAAIDAADTQTPDVICMELQLPAHNGVEFLYELRSYAEWQKIPVVINSYTSPSALSAVRETLKRDLGVVAVLYKPRTSLEHLIRCVREYAGTPA